MQSLTGLNLSYASGKRDRQWESVVLVCIGISSLKTNNSLHFPPEKRSLWNDLNLLPNCEEKQHKNRHDGSREGWTSERRMLGTDDKTMEFRDTDEWRSRCHQICCLKITSKQINMSGWGRGGGGKNERRGETGQAGDSLANAITSCHQRPWGTAGPSEGCSQDRPSDPLHPRSPL